MIVICIQNFRFFRVFRCSWNKKNIRMIRVINFVDFSTARHSSNEFGSVQALNEKFVFEKKNIL
jgi:hypothetical protein